jgi:hypothetical protein
MNNSERQFYVFDLELCARKVGATVPTMNDIVPVFQRMHATRKTYPLRSNSASMLIGDMEVDFEQEFITLLVRLSDTTAPNSVYSDPASGHYHEHTKAGNVGSDFACHVLISTAQEKKLANVYTCAIERLPGLPFEMIRRFLSKLLHHEYSSNPTFFSYLHPAGGIGADKQPRRDRCCPHVELRGRSSDTLINDLDTGRITGVSLIKTESVTPIAGAPFLNKSSSELKLGIDHGNIPANLWQNLSDVFKRFSKKYDKAKIKYRIPDSQRTFTVEIDAKTCAPLTEMYIKSFEISNIFPFLAQSSKTIVPHLHEKVVTQFLAHRTK